MVSEKIAPKNLISEFYKRENLNDPGMVGSINSCHIVKDVQCFNKSKTKGSSHLINLNKTFLTLKTNFKGLLSITHGCGINLRFNEMISAESRASVIRLLKTTIEITQNSYKNCIYDNGCHLDESVKAHIDCHPTLSNMRFYIDRFHLKNHSRKVGFIYN